MDDNSQALGSTKKILLEQIQAVLTSELEVLRTSARSARDAATHADARAENKYDTRGLEASYLAGAQQARIAEIVSQQQVLSATVPRTFAANAAIAATALVELRTEAGGADLYFLVAQGAGLRLAFDNRSVLVVTPQSPLGRMLIGKRTGACVTINTAQGRKEYEIVSIR